MPIDQNARKQIVKRLHYISGQIGGIEQMLEDNRSVTEIHGQLRARASATPNDIRCVTIDDQLKIILQKWL